MGHITELKQRTHIGQLLQCRSFLNVTYNLLTTQRHIKHVHFDFDAVYIKYCFMHSVCFSYNGPI